MQGSIGGSDLQLALEARVPYDFLPAPLQQRLTPSQYKDKAIHYAVLRCQGYHRLPDHIRATTSEKEYYDKMITVGSQFLQVYPYAHQDCIVHFTKETSLSYYTTMLAELLKSEKSYDRLPNFTAIDILNLLGIGRNQYLNLTREVRSKVRWHINRSYVLDHLPQQMLPTVTLDPFARVAAVERPSEVIKKLQTQQQLSLEAVTLYRLLCKKGTQAGLSQSSSALTASLALPSSFAASEVFFSCELPYEPLHALYRCGLVYTTATVDPDDCLVIPPLGDQFVMNRTSDEPMEVLLYRLLSTVDEQTPMNLLAQLLMLNEDDVCVAAQLLVQLRLAYIAEPHIPEKIRAAPSLAAVVHASWRQDVQRQMDRLAALHQSHPPVAVKTALEEAAAAADTDGDNDDGQTASRNAAETGHHPLQRIALLYDATMTGFLMMTNLSRDPTFKQLAVTLFEVGRMPSNMVSTLLALLEKVDFAEHTSFGGEAQTYLNSVFCLRELLRALFDIRGPPNTTAGVDMLKIESLNELEATTRYSVLGRHYWAYVLTSPIACAPLLDVELSNVYGATVSFMPSPWLLLFLYVKTHCGPPSALLPFGTMLSRWPGAFTDAAYPAEDNPDDGDDGGLGYDAHLRLQAMTLGAEVSYAPVDTSLVLAGEMTSTAPLFVQCCARTPLIQRKDGTVVAHTQYAHKEVLIPFSHCTEEDVVGLVQAKLTGEPPHLSRHTVDPSSEKDSDNAPSSCLIDDVDTLFPLIQRSAEALHVTHSLGYFTVCITYERYAVEAPAGLGQEDTDMPPDQRDVNEDEQGGQGETAREEVSPASSSPRLRYRVHTGYIVGIQLGVPLTDVLCCRLMVRSLPTLLSEAESDLHNAAMRVCVDEFGTFLEQYSPLTRAVHGKLALQSSDIGGPMTQLHLRRTGGVGGSPFPTSSLVFDGSSITVVEDHNPLSEQW